MQASVLPPSVELVRGDVYQFSTLERALADSNVMFIATGSRPAFDPFGPFNVDYQVSRAAHDTCLTVHLFICIVKPHMTPLLRCTPRNAFALTFVCCSDDTGQFLPAGSCKPCGSWQASQGQADCPSEQHRGRRAILSSEPALGGEPQPCVKH